MSWGLIWLEFLPFNDVTDFQNITKNYLSYCPELNLSTLLYLIPGMCNNIFWIFRQPENLTVTTYQFLIDKKIFFL